VLHKFGSNCSPLDGFEDGYANFRQELDRGEAGFFTVSPADLVRSTMAQLSQDQV